MIRNLKKNPSVVPASLAGMEQTAGGIIAPTAAVEANRVRTVDRWLEARWKVVRRAFKELMLPDVAVTVALFCNVCEKRLHPTPIDALHFSLRCDCKDRVVTKGI